MNDFGIRPSAIWYLALHKAPFPNAWDEYKEDECSICLDDISYNQLINQNLLNKDYVKIKCDHIFHRECISGWLKKNRTCPICRDEIY